MDEMTPELLDTMTRLAKGEDVKFDVSPMVGFFLVSTIQFAMRHPAFPPKVGAQVVRFARAMTEALDRKVPGAKSLLEQGWDPSLDVPIERST